MKFKSIPKRMLGVLLLQAGRVPPDFGPQTPVVAWRRWYFKCFDALTMLGKTITEREIVMAVALYTAEQEVNRVIHGPPPSAMMDDRMDYEYVIVESVYLEWKEQRNEATT